MSRTRSEAVIELGKRLVAELDDDNDLLASWMAHYIAEQIDAAQNAPVHERSERQQACAEAILQLWRHRNVLPQHLRPLGEIEPVLRTLASLDVEQRDYRYSGDALRAAAVAEVDEDTKHLLELAIGIDYTARLLIQFALRAAAEPATSNAQAWVELAQQAAADEGVDRAVVRFILDSDGGREPVEDYEKARLRDRLSRLDAFMELASSWAAELRTQLDSAEPKSQ